MPDDAQHRIEALPDELLHWLLPSRLCESDALYDEAWELFGSTTPGAERVQAVCDWIHGNVAYGVPSVPTTATVEVFERRGGMCRDFAHLGVTLLPRARHPGPLRVRLHAGHRHPRARIRRWTSTPGSRSGSARSWWTFDARFNTPRIGRVPIGRGRDAVDVAMVTTYGAATLVRMAVWADEVGDADELTAVPPALATPSGQEWRGRMTPLGDLIATLGSIDDDEIDWQNVRQTTVLIHQSFAYEYPGPITALRHRLMVVPPDYHDDQRLLTHKLRVSGCDVDIERSYDTFGNVVLDLGLQHVERDVDVHGLGGGRARGGDRRQGRRPMRSRVDQRFLEPSRLTRARRRAARRSRRSCVADGRAGQSSSAERIATPGPRPLRVPLGPDRRSRRPRRRRGPPAIGVCQDYAHCMLALCRLCGLPARYVSGHVLGEGGTHAWVEVLVPHPQDEGALCARCRSTPPTTAARGCGTSPSPSAATTATSRPPRARSRRRTPAR